MKKAAIIIGLCLIVFSCKTQQDSNLRYEPEWYPFQWKEIELKGNIKRIITRYEKEYEDSDDVVMESALTGQYSVFYDTIYYSSFNKPVKTSGGEYFTYNDKQQLVKKVTMGISQEYDDITDDFIYKDQTTTYLYTYNDAGLITQEETRIDDKSSYIISWEYDDKGRILNHTEQSNNFSIKESYTYSGNTIKMVRKRAGIDVSGSETFIWTYDEQGRRVKEDFTTSLSSDRSIASYRYNDKNQLIEKVSDFATIRYKYDKHGNLEECVEVDNETGRTSDLYRLTSDEHGNYISFYHKDTYFGGVENSTRVIEYY